MNKQNHFTILEVIDRSTGIVRETDEILESYGTSFVTISQKKDEISDAIKKGQPLYLCASCRQPVFLAGGYKGVRRKALHFRHKEKHEECIYFNGYDVLTPDEVNRIKFHGLPESELHKKLKGVLKEILEGEGYKVEVEKNVSLIREISGEKIAYQKLKKIFRRPDVMATRDNHSVVFEVQLSSTSSEVIRERTRFYKEKKKHIIWIVDSLDVETDNISFTQADILGAANWNIFQLDEEMIAQSRSEHKLYLKCCFWKPVIKDDTVSYEWDSKVVTLENLVYGGEYQTYYYDSATKAKECAQTLGVDYAESSFIPYKYNEGLKLDLLWERCVGLESFFYALYAFDTYSIAEQCMPYIRRFIDGNYNDSDLGKLVYLSFIYKLSKDVDDIELQDEYRRLLSNYNNVYFLVQLTSYKFGRDALLLARDLKVLTSDFLMTQSSYAHLILSLVNHYNCKDIVGDLNYTELMKCSHNEHSLDRDLDDLSIVLFQSIERSLLEQNITGKSAQLDLDKIFALPYDLFQFIEALKPYDTKLITSMSHRYIEDFDSLTTYRALQTVYSPSDIEKILFLVFVNRVYQQVGDRDDLKLFRNHLNSKYVIGLLVKLVSFRFNKVIGSHCSNIGLLAKELYKDYSVYSHIIMGMMDRYGYSQELKETYKKLSLVVKGGYIYHDLDDLVKMVLSAKSDTVLKNRL